VAPSSAWIRGIIALTALVALGVLLASGEEVSPSMLRSFGIAANTIVLLVLVFDRWAWRWPIIRSLVRRPVIHGTWHTDLRSTFEERNTETIESYLVIRQTFSRISTAMLFEHSTSMSMTAELVKSEGRYLLSYLFRSDKVALQSSQNPPARGAAVLRVATAPNVHLEGDYWMHVGTKGEVKTRGRARVLYDTFAGARRGSYS
jgi:hypothetical protein